MSFELENAIIEKGLRVHQVNAFHISMAPDFIVSFSDKEGMHCFQKSRIGLKMVDDAETIKDKEAATCHCSATIALRTKNGQ